MSHGLGITPALMALYIMSNCSWVQSPLVRRGYSRRPDRRRGTHWLHWLVTPIKVPLSINTITHRARPMQNAPTATRGDGKLSCMKQATITINNFRRDTAMEPIIRARRQDEIAMCVALLADVHVVDGYPTRWPTDPHDWLTPKNLLAAWVAEDKGALLGHVALCAATGDAAAPVWSAASGLPADQIAAVARLFVAPSARGRRLGAALLAAACAEAYSRRLRPALDVVDHDSAAMALYERAGWQRIASAPAPWTLANGERPVLHYYLAPPPTIDGVDRTLGRASRQP